MIPCLGFFLNTDLPIMTTQTYYGRRFKSGHYACKVQKIKNLQDNIRKIPNFAGLKNNLMNKQLNKISYGKFKMV